MRWFTPFDPKLVKRIGSGCKTIRNGYAHAGKVSNHFTRGGILPQLCLHHSRELVMPKAPAVTSHCWTRTILL